MAQKKMEDVVAYVGAAGSSVEDAASQGRRRGGCQLIEAGEASGGGGDAGPGELSGAKAICAAVVFALVTLLGHGGKKAVRVFRPVEFHAPHSGERALAESPARVPHPQRGASFNGRHQDDARRQETWHSRQGWNTKERHREGRREKGQGEWLGVERGRNDKTENDDAQPNNAQNDTTQRDKNKRDKNKRDRRRWKGRGVAAIAPPATMSPQARETWRKRIARRIDLPLLEFGRGGPTCCGGAKGEVLRFEGLHIFLLSRQPRPALSRLCLGIAPPTFTKAKGKTPDCLAAIEGLRLRQKFSTFLDNAHQSGLDAQ